MDSLPDDILAKIFAFFEMPEEHMPLFAVCKSWNHICRTNPFSWKCMKLIVSSNLFLKKAIELSHNLTGVTKIRIILLTNPRGHFHIPAHISNITINELVETDDSSYTVRWDAAAPRLTWKNEETFISSFNPFVIAMEGRVEGYVTANVFAFDMEYSYPSIHASTIVFMIADYYDEYDLTLNIQKIFAKVEKLIHRTDGTIKVYIDKTCFNEFIDALANLEIPALVYERTQWLIRL